MKKVEKLLYLSTGVFPSRSANSVHIMRMCQAFSKVGYKVTNVFSANDNNKNLNDLYAYYNVEPVFTLKRLRKLLPGRLNSLYMGLWACFAKSNVIYSRDNVAVILPALLGKPCFVEVHESMVKSKLVGYIFKLLSHLKGVRGFIVISQALKDDCVKNFPHLAGKIFVAHDGADPLKEPLPVYKKQKGEPFNVGYVGQLYKGKGMELIAQIAPLAPWAHFHIVGGREDDIHHWQKQTKGMTNITFHGFKKQKELPPIMAMFDVVLAPYMQVVTGQGQGKNLAQYMSPLKVFEYMSAKKVMICSDLPVLHEVLEHGRTCLFAQPSQPQKWVDALKHLQENEKRAEQIATQAQQEFMQKYTWQKRAENISQFIKSKMEA